MLERELIRKQVSERLVATREDRGLSQEEAARVVDCSLRQYHRWEGRLSTPSRLYRKRILDALDLDLSDLFTSGAKNGAVVDLLQAMNGKLDRLLEKDPP